MNAVIALQKLACSSAIGILAEDANSNISCACTGNSCASYQCTAQTGVS